MFRRVLFVALAVLSLSVLAPPAASANHGWDSGWYHSDCRHNVWWTPAEITDTSTGVVWGDGYQWWIDYGIWGYNVWSSYGPIQGTWAGWGWECGALGYPVSNVYYSHSSGGYPVFRQGFSRGYIDWHPRNLCRCYNWGGFASVVRY